MGQRILGVDSAGEIAGHVEMLGARPGLAGMWAVLQGARVDKEGHAFSGCRCGCVGFRCVGVNRRYGDRQLDAKVAEAMLRQQPIFLTAAELDLASCSAVAFDPQRRVWAWVRYPSQALQVQAMATAWTKRAVRVRFLEPFVDSPVEGWLWAGAVRPAGEEDPPPPPAMA